MVGVMPFGLIFGALAVETGLTPLQIVAMSAITFGGRGRLCFCNYMQAVPIRF